MIALCEEETQIKLQDAVLSLHWNLLNNFDTVCFQYHGVLLLLLQTQTRNAVIVCLQTCWKLCDCEKAQLQLLQLQHNAC